MRLIKYLLVLCALAFAVPAFAGEYVTTPKPTGNDVRSYDRGQVILTRETEKAIIAVFGSGNYYGRPSFVIEVTNKTDHPFDFGVENMSVEFPGQKKPTVVYTRADLDAQAQNRAAWASLAAAMAGSMSGYSSYSSNTYVPRLGTITTRGTYYNNGIALANSMALMGAVQDGLSNRLADAANSAVQTTTIPPGASYGGRVVYSKPKAKLPSPMTLTVRIDGTEETFSFDVRK
jgi:hypothetical protein